MLLPATTASAATPTKVVVSLKFPAFHGKLTSSRQSCLGSRKVKMYRERNGKKKLLGSDTSEDNGKWAIPVGKNLTSGAYFATVAKRGKCKAAKSKVLPID
ncbi:MAG TPA: hypothetical protein VFR04_05135 [Solirubrobacterales bacterium]|nr:hypothetical protein [Solirubrobacterales bacterium]